MHWEGSGRVILMICIVLILKSSFQFSYICGFYGIRRGNYFEEELIRRNDKDVRLKRPRNRKVADKVEVNGEMVKVGVRLVIDWACKLFIMAFENDVVNEVWRSAVNTIV